jgi:outer membrane lipoprotein-sorting protein
MLKLRTTNSWASLFIAISLLSVLSAQSQNKTSDAPFVDEPAARTLYQQMIDSLRKADTLSWISQYRWEARGNTIGQATYRIWLKKPNYARIEASPVGAKEPAGIVVLDGSNIWIYWPKEKPRYGWENSGKYADEYERYRSKFYIKVPAPNGRHSLGHQTDFLGAGMSMPILDPSTFHGYTDSLQAYIDGARCLGTEKVGDILCDVVEVSLMKHQRSWHFWLAKSDHLPRKLKQIVRVSYDIIMEESWSEVTQNAEISDNRFAWSPPADWKEWRMPRIEEGLLTPGTIAPDFTLASADGSQIKLSNFRGKIVWLNKWRCG